MGDSGDMSEAEKTSLSEPSQSRSIGLTLIEPFVAAIFVVAIGLAIKWLGWPVIRTTLEISIGFVAFVFLWSRSDRAAPGITRAVSVLALVAVLLSVLPAWLLERRDAARKTQSIDNLKKFSQDWQVQESLSPPTRKSR